MWTSSTVVTMNESDAQFFAFQLPFNCLSYYSQEPLDLDKLSCFCSSDGGYVINTLNSLDKIWRIPKKGWQLFSDLWFTYGFRLFMHPFFLIVLETFDFAEK